MPVNVHSESLHMFSDEATQALWLDSVRFDVLWIIKNGVPYMGKEKRKQQDFQ
jgi:hypothetical protein